MQNAAIARLFAEIADLLEIKGENPFRVRAYRRAVESLEALGEDVAAVAERDALEDIPGIGKDLAGKIREFLKTGGVPYLDELRREIPAGVVELMGIHGVGPRTAKLLFDQAGVDSVPKLEELARAGRLAGLPGIKARTEQNILKGIAVWKAGRERMPLGRALGLAEAIVGALGGLPGVARIETAGSLRRMRETVKDIDILVTARDAAPVMRAFVGLPGVAEVLAHGETKSSVRLAEGIQADLRVVEPEAFGAALQYFTGSKAHNIRVRDLAVRKGFKLSEYGVFAAKGERRVAGASEEEVYAALGLPWIPPELREDAGEVEAALEGRLPRLVEGGDIRGDLHCHTDWSDGRLTLEELVRAAKARGYAYVAVADHSRSSTVANGLDARRLEEQLKAIEALREKVKGITVLAGSEVDIRADGTLDFPDELLARLDVVVASVHSRFTQDERTMTDRILRALRNPHVRILGHATGRLLGERDPYAVDLDAVFAAARDAGVAVEINASPQRLDVKDAHARRARELGVMLTIDTDAHAEPHLDFMRLGVGTARRAWLGPDAILNTRSAKDLLAWLRRPSKR
jgi:DNA polymerase (family 10)